MIGETLLHYRILAQIGAGGMGAVYRAEDLKLHREVALKILPPELAGNIERFERFQREARSVAALNHPNIVTLFSVEEDAGRHFITMELVKGKPLNQVIPKSGLGVKEFLELAVPLADALASAHEKGITHRDLKPANVMIDEAGRVKVIDFGLAKAAGGQSSPDLSQAPTEQLTMEGRILGTPAYMSPEQVEGKPVDHRTDIFALGILYHEMLTGDRPFKGDSTMAIMSAVLKDDPASISSLRPEVPLEISRVIRRCLQKHPNERSQSALDVRNELKGLQTEFLTGTLTAVHPAPDAVHKKSSIVNWTLGIVGANLVLAIVAMFFWKGDGGDSQATSEPGAASRAPAASGIPKITRLATTDRLEAMPTFSPDGRHIAFVAAVGQFKQIFIREVGAPESRQLTQGDYDHIQPAWGPDTNTMFYAKSVKSGTGIGIGDAKIGFYITAQAEIVRHTLGTGEQRVILSGAAYPSIAPGGSELVFVRDNRIFKSDLQGGRQAQLSEDDETMNHADPRVAVDGRVVFRRFNVSEGLHQIAVVTPRREMTVVREKGALNPTWHPSGDYVYFTMYGASGRNIWRLPLTSTNTAAGEPEPVTVGGGDDLEPAFSPDGRRMVFSVSSVNADIYRVAIDPVTGATNGPAAEPMPFNSNREDSRAAWAPSVEQPMLAFNSDRGGDMNLYIWRERDNSVTQVTSGPGGDYQATWSPDLRQLVFFSSRDGHADVYVVGTNALSVPVRLTDAPGMDFNPFFSPDGRHIAFESTRDGSRDVYLMDADGKNQRPLPRSAPGNLYLNSHYINWFDGESLLGRVKVEGVTDLYRVFIADGRLEKVSTLDPFPSIGGHGSFSPDRKRLMDLDGPHAHIWVISLTENAGELVYRKVPQASIIDYPWWSPDGRRATFDVSIPRNSELLMAEWSTP